MVSFLRHETLVVNMVIRIYNKMVTYLYLISLIINLIKTELYY